MANIVDFEHVSLAGLESSPVSKSIAGLRANESRYFKNKYGHDFAVSPVSESKETLDYVNEILRKERSIQISSKPLETSSFIVENTKFSYVFYESGLAINVMYSLKDPKKRAVGFKLSEGMEVPIELEGKFKFATQKSKLAGNIRGSFFVIKNEYWKVIARCFDIAKYPDSDKMLIAPSYEIFQKGSQASYFDGEEHIKEKWREIEK